MDDDLDLRDFENVCRLFPLPGVVLFPHAILPLHIFEPRYRQMTEDALAGDHLVTIVQLLKGSSGGPSGLPPIAEVGCLGRILQHERLPDGRFNFLLLGRKRVRLNREIPSPKLYRVAEVEVLDDCYGHGPEEPRRSELIALFRRVFERRQALDDELSAMLDSALPLGVLTDILAHALGLPAAVNQALLAEPSVDRRVAGLLEVLRQVVAADALPGKAGGARPFPPPFSSN